MKTLLVATMVLLCAPAFGGSYSTDFESDTIGLLPLDPGWYLSGPWWDIRPLASATVEAGPTGGQVLSVQWQTTFPEGQPSFSSGEVGYTMPGAVPGAGLTVAVEYDFWVENTGIWQTFGDQGSGPLVGGALNDNNDKRDWMYVGRDDGSGDPADITDIPDGAWVHYEGAYDKSTGVMDSTVSFTGGSGGFVQQLTGRVDNINCEYWWGGWGYDFQMLAGNVGTAREGTYDHALYIDNFAMTCTVPEPGIFLLAGLGLLALIRRRK
jgi:MYXO-CTERM domain-containing protein